MNNFVVTTEDIEYAEKLLLKGGKKFDADEKIPIISCMDRSIEIIACPGSGKTTTLLAKLCILSNKIPFENRKGIAIITHTNVAIEEIKNKLGFKSDMFFNYPNYFGTIHAFINKYLAVPYYKKTFNSNIKFIDNDRYYKRLVGNFSPYSKLGKNIYFKVKNELTDREFSMLSKEEIGKAKINYLCKIYMEIDKNDLIFKKDGKTIARNPNTDFYIELYKLFHIDMLEHGYLRYDDSFLLAKLYINTYPEIVKFFSKRFNYLFIDETQDNSSVQNQIIKKLFEEGETIVQRFGDPNQGIYDSVEPIKPENSVGSSVFEISRSMRYSQAIANFISPLRVFDSSKKLIGNSDIDNILPHFIIYDKKKIGEVKEEFVKLIKYFKLKDDTHPFKAVGWVGYNRNAERITIESYFPEFISQKKLITQIDKNNFHSFLKNNIKRKRTVGNIYKSILEFFTNYLILVEYKIDNQVINKTKFENHFKEHHLEEFYNFRTKAYKWSKMIFSNDEVVYIEIKTYLVNLLNLFINIDKADIDYFHSLFDVKEELDKEDYSGTLNSYTNDDITIVTDTIHGVKGETHTATLYLQTFYKENDLKRIINFILKKPKSNPNAEEVKSLKMAYVGMSRATQLLCIAIHDECLSDSQLKELYSLADKGDIAIVKI